MNLIARLANLAVVKHYLDGASALPRYVANKALPETFPAGVVKGDEPARNVLLSQLNDPAVPDSYKRLVRDCLGLARADAPEAETTALPASSGAAVLAFPGRKH